MCRAAYDDHSKEYPGSVQFGQSVMAPARDDGVMSLPYYSMGPLPNPCAEPARRRGGYLEALTGRVEKDAGGRTAK